MLSKVIGEEWFLLLIVMSWLVNVSSLDMRYLLLHAEGFH